MVSPEDESRCVDKKIIEEMEREGTAGVQRIQRSDVKPQRRGAEEAFEFLVIIEMPDDLGVIVWK